jgi:hypothetical protein
VVVEGVGREERRGDAVGIEDLGTKLTRGVYSTSNHNRQCIKFSTCVLQWGACSRDVTIDDLSKSDMATIGGEVEGLSLYRCRVQDLPFEILLCEFGVGNGL